MIKGLHIDPCRHFIECDTILKTIDLMAKLGFNTLHLHLSDDQSMPFESNKYPQIKFKHMLTIQDQCNIALACRNYNIDIIPELDIPGHSQAFRYIFENEPFEDKLGVIIPKYIDLDKHLPIIFDLFEELVDRFSAKYIHIGCDEAKTYTEFPKLIDSVNTWIGNKDLKFIVWDDVVSKIATIPEKMIVQRWRHYTSGKINSLSIPYILSEGYYLDHCEDPLYIYTKNPNKYGKNLIGHIACTWSELIDNNNFYNTIVPSIYLLARRWNDLDKNESNHLPEILYQMCEQYGYPESDKYDSWKRRRWASFLKDVNDPRNIANMSTDILLDREHDQYPVFSRFLIELLYILYLIWIKKESHEILNKIDFYRNQLNEIIQKNFNSGPIDWLFDRSTQKEVIKQNIFDLIDRMKNNVNIYYHNGLIPVLRFIGYHIKSGEDIKTIS